MKNLEEFVLFEEQNEFNQVDGKKPRVDKNSKNNVKWSLNEETDEPDFDLDDPNHTLTVKRLITRFEDKKPFFIQGRAGWGKTAIIERLADKFNYEVVTVYLDKAEAVDLDGLPVPVPGKRSKMVTKNALGKDEEREFATQIKAMPDWAKLMWENPDKQFLLFLDEMNQAQPDVQNALMPIVKEQIISRVKFKNFFVGAAGNFEDENSAISELSGPLMSRFGKTLIWETGTPRAWKQAFEYLHKKWDKALSPEIVSMFEDNAMCFNNPREIDDKVLSYIYNRKKDGGRRIDVEILLAEITDIAKEDLSRSEEKELSKLADNVFEFITNKDTGKKTSDSKPSGGRRDSNQVPQSIQQTVESAMTRGYVSIEMEDENGNKRDVKFGVCKETIAEIIDSDECNAEMLERTIAKFEANGIKWTYDKPQNWSKLGLEDPLDSQWGLVVTSKTKIDMSEPKKPKKKVYKD